MHKPNRRVNVIVAIMLALLAAFAMGIMERYSMNRQGRIVEGGASPSAPVIVSESAVPPGVPDMGAITTTGLGAVASGHRLTPLHTQALLDSRTRAVTGLVGAGVSPNAKYVPPPFVWTPEMGDPHHNLPCSDPRLPGWRLTPKVRYLWCIAENGQEIRTNGGWAPPESNASLKRSADLKLIDSANNGLFATSPSDEYRIVVDGRDTGMTCHKCDHPDTAKALADPTIRTVYCIRGTDVEAWDRNDHGPRTMRLVSSSLSGFKAEFSGALNHVQQSRIRCQAEPLTAMTPGQCGWYRSGSEWRLWDGKQLTDVRLLACSDPRIAQVAGAEYMVYVSAGAKNGQWPKTTRKGLDNVFCDDSIQILTPPSGSVTVPGLTRMNPDDNEVSPFALFARHDWIAKHRGEVQR